MDIQTALQKELNDFVNQPFPDTAANKHFALVPGLLRKFSPYTLKVTIEDFIDVATVTPETATYKQAGNCLNMLVTQTMASLEMDIDQYTQFYRDIEEGFKLLNDHVGSEQKRLKSKGEELSNVGNKSGRTIDIAAKA